MPDICMCAAKYCAIKSRCYRFAATPNERQTMSDFSLDSQSSLWLGEMRKMNCEWFFQDYRIPKESEDDIRK